MRQLLGLGVKEIQEMIDEEGGIETQCHFCLETYDFSEAEFKDLLMKSIRKIHE